MITLDELNKRLIEQHDRIKEHQNNLNMSIDFELSEYTRLHRRQT